MTAPTIHTHNTANEAQFLAPQDNQGAVLKPIQHMTLAEFLSLAVAKKLINHGRAFEVFVSERSLGFADGTEQEALVQVHSREVNNALWSFEAGDAALEPSLLALLPSPEALLAHPQMHAQMHARFPIATARVAALATESSCNERGAK
jgi:hypothetical protein